jgi:hypothetical protein
LILALAAAGAGTARAESFFGIELGAPFSVRECTADDIGAVNRPLDICTPHGEDTHHPWGAITHTVRLVGSLETHGINEMFVKEFNGSVVNIGAVTYGEAVQDLVNRELFKKFGTPHSSSKSLVHNAFGAKFAALHARWAKPGYTVVFEGMSGSRDAGEIDISANAAASEERAANAWRAAKEKAGAQM